MAERNTAITGKQIKAAVAADGLQKDANQNLAIDVSDFIDTDYGLVANGEDIRVSLEASGGLDFTAGALGVDVTDFIDTAAGLEETGGDIQVNIDTAFLEFDTGAITLKDDSITEVKLDINNAPVDGYYLKYVTATGMTWADVSAGYVEFSDIIANEIPSGSIDDNNTDFQFANTPSSGTLQVLLNGIQQEPGSGKDYTLSVDTVTFAEAPDTGDIVLGNYVKA